MAVATKGNDGSESLSNRDKAEIVRDSDEIERPRRGGSPPRGTTSSASSPAKVGFLRIYKPGQGYWTRMGTAGGVGLILVAVVAFLYEQMATWDWLKRPAEGGKSQALQPNLSAIIGILTGLVALVALSTFRALNKPKFADFLISTEGEMRKVNWSTRRELIGSTKVVILFMMLIGLFLFVLDILFGLAFFKIGVLQFNPFGSK